MIYAVYGTLAILVLIAIVCWIVDNERPLPKPRADDRQWSINYMTDRRKWTTRL